MTTTRRQALKNFALTAFGSSSALSFLSSTQTTASAPQPIHISATALPSPRSLVNGPRSPVLKGIEWLSREIPYPEPEKRGDSFPITWAADDNLYTSAGDPVWGDRKSGLDLECFRGMAPDYHVTKVNEMSEYVGWGGCGPKPSGMISVKGILYLAFQNLTGKRGNTADDEEILVNYGSGYDAHVVSSSDYGKTWKPELKAIAQPMFPGRLFGGPAFINFGKDNEGARDGYVYAISGEGWDNGCHCRLGRAPADQILNRGSWEWVTNVGPDTGPEWSKNMTDGTPVLSHPGYLGVVDMVYVHSMRRYLLLAWRNKVKVNPDSGSELIIYDSPEPWGPFTLAHHEDPWESTELNPYNPRLPLKWFDQKKLEGWMLFSGSWRSGGRTPFYRSHIRKFRLLPARL